MNTVDWFVELIAWLSVDELYLLWVFQLRSPAVLYWGHSVPNFFLRMGDNTVTGLSDVRAGAGAVVRPNALQVAGRDAGLKLMEIKRWSRPRVENAGSR